MSSIHSRNGPAGTLHSHHTQCHHWAEHSPYQEHKQAAAAGCCVVVAFIQASSSAVKLHKCVFVNGGSDTASHFGSCTRPLLKAPILEFVWQHVGRSSTAEVLYVVG